MTALAGEFLTAVRAVRQPDREYMRAQGVSVDSQMKAGLWGTAPIERNLATLMLMLERRFDVEGINVTGITSAKIASRILRGHLDIIVVALLIVALLMLFVGSLGMASGISSSVVERTREIGILRAIGGKPGAIRAILSSEAMVMALIGWLAAALLAPTLSRFLTEYFGTALVEYPFDYRASFAGLYLGLAATLAIAALATIAPAMMAIRQSVKDAISYE